MAIIIININIIIIIVIIIIIMFIIIEYSQEVPMLKNSLSHITISNSILVEHCNINWCRLRLSITLIWR